MKNKFIFFLLLFGITTVAMSCYSFTGASIPPYIKTIAVPLLSDESRSGISQFRENMTESILKTLRDGSSLQITDDKKAADSYLEAAIVEYSNRPSQLSSSSERASKNKIQITIRAIYHDNVKKKKLFEETFTNFDEYDVSSGNPQLQQQALTNAIQKVSEDIFNKIVSGW